MAPPLPAIGKRVSIDPTNSLSESCNDVRESMVYKLVGNPPAKPFLLKSSSRSWDSSDKQDGSPTILLRNRTKLRPLKRQKSSGILPCRLFASVVRHRRSQRNWEERKNLVGLVSMSQYKLERGMKNEDSNYLTKIDSYYHGIF